MRFGPWEAFLLVLFVLIPLGVISYVVYLVIRRLRKTGEDPHR